MTTSRLAPNSSSRRYFHKADGFNLALLLLYSCSAITAYRRTAPAATRRSTVAVHLEDSFAAHMEVASCGGILVQPYSTDRPSDDHGRAKPLPFPFRRVREIRGPIGTKHLKNQEMRGVTRAADRLLLPIRKKLLTYAEAQSPVRGVQNMRDFQRFLRRQGGRGRDPDAVFAPRAPISLLFPFRLGLPKVSGYIGGLAARFRLATKGL